MMNSLKHLLTSYLEPEFDEFEIGKVRVLVEHSSDRSCSQLAEMEKLLAEAQEEIPAVATFVTSSLCSSEPATVVSIRISSDLSVEYGCFFVDGEYFKKYFHVHREPNGDLLFAH